jgi:hypothetical protein
VVPTMFGLRHHLQVLPTVVCSNFVVVMDYFSSLKRSTKHLFRHKTVLGDKAP